MGVKDLSINFTNNQTVFKPGSSVIGSVAFRLTKTTKIKAISAKVHGFCKTKWSVGSDDKKYYKEKENYTLQELVLWGGREQITTLQPGNHQKAFSFLLPNNCPSSFSSKYGEIKYSITIICKYSGLSNNQDYTKPFRVYDKVDLTQNPQTAELFYRPMQIRGTGQDDCCFCCNNVSAEVKLTTDKSAYAPGDEIALNGFIDNRSNDPLPFSMTLYQRITCYGRRSDFSFTSSGNLKSKEKEVAVCSWSGPPIPQSSKKDFRNQPSMKIPGVVATGLRNCKFINVSYYIKFKVVLHGCGDNSLQIRHFDVVIGHRSLPSYDALSNAVPSAPIAPSAPVDDSFAPPYVPPSAPTDVDLVEVNLQDHVAPPPSYFEATAMDVPPVTEVPPPSEMERL